MEASRANFDSSHPQMSLATMEVAEMPAMKQLTSEIASSRAPKVKIRRYGRADYDEFEESTLGPHLCVGSSNIGKAEIDCKYHWRKAAWGVLGTHETPAGILYMDIAFRQPPGHWLHTASVFITMSETETSYALLKRGLKRDSICVSSIDDNSVQMTEHFGPRTLVGIPSIESRTQSTKLTPTFGFTGIEVGGVGFESNTSKDMTGQWVFQGSLRKPKDGNSYRTLQWDLTPNELDGKHLSRQEFSTAFAFQHRQRPVYMRVEIDGRLGSRCKRMQQKFSTKLGKQDKSTLTHIHFGEGFKFTKCLDEAAQSLNSSMELENLRKTPRELPDSIPAEDVGPKSPSLLFFETDAQSKNAVLGDKIEAAEDALTIALRRCLEEGPGSDLTLEETSQNSEKGVEDTTSNSSIDAISLNWSLEERNGEEMCVAIARVIVFFLSCIVAAGEFLSQLPAQAALTWRLVSEQPWDKIHVVGPKVITHVMNAEDDVKPQMVANEQTEQ
ncbi:hypothetical protein B0J13DRAFT_539113 [Dactylonectria estremocensis]|uniref:Uncharacterized protein n=1 Tax=Dactylonectria estremocensis TaxID=1079267 RepID=A0A9P9FAR3_9HYPO|nr:hypothetical protein B0J13DRAFT_539113 [Dactylonectria estremocensis]